MNRTINDIIPPSRRPKLTPEGGYDPVPQTPMPPRPTSGRAPRKPSGSKRFPYGTAIVALLVIVGSGVALYAFSGAKVEVTPVSNSVSITGDFTSTPGTGDLPYQIVTVDKTASQSVPAESTETVNDPASGSIVISNAQATAQTLIKNTRFESANGMIFRIHDSVTIPPANGSKPGSLTATVYADAGGDQYNIGATTFTVPGLQGSAAFTQVTAKSSEAMAGGFSGTRPSVSQTTRDTQNVTNQASLAKSLATDIQSKIPAGYILVPGATFTTYEPQPDAPGASGTVSVGEKGTLVAVVFPEDAFAKAIAYKSIGTYAGQEVTVPDVGALTLAPAVDVAPTATDTNFAFTLSGNTTIVWKIDPTKIAAAVAGKTRDSANVALQALPEVDHATLVIHPFWQNSYPQDPAKISVTVVDPTAAK